MKAITLWQPWASLWCSPCKVHETRHWPTKHRGSLLVHAAKRFERDVSPELDSILSDEFGNHWGMELPTGAIVGVVNVVACRRTDQITEIISILEFSGVSGGASDRACGDFTPGRFGWQRREFHRFERPIKYLGAQGLFEVPDEIVAEQLAACGWSITGKVGAA